MDYLSPEFLSILIDHIVKRKRYNNIKGQLAETLAALFLMVKGYKILARRYKVKAGEIDIIALKGKRLAFVEVKLRSDREKALEALTTYQQKRIIHASKFWLSKHAYYRKFYVSYDYVIFVPWKIPSHIKYFYNEN